MIPILENRLEEILNRHKELESELSNTSISTELRMNLSKEHNELSPIVNSINELKKCQSEIDGVDEILNNNNTDSLLKEEALKELSKLKKLFNTFKVLINSWFYKPTMISISYSLTYIRNIYNCISIFLKIFLNF